MNKEELTIVNMTEDEARLFVAFQKRRVFMELLESVDAFSIKGGSITIHFDNLGGVGSVDVHRHYRLPS